MGWRSIRTAFVVGTATLSWAGLEGQEDERRKRAAGRIVPLVGHWEELAEEGRPVFLLDARRWRRDVSQPAFPVAVSSEHDDFSEGTLRVRFKLIDGVSDRSAGLVFDYKPSGEYLFVRYNTREGNAAVWRFANGARTALAKGEQQAQLALGVWHDIVVQVSGDTIVGTVNDTLRVEHKVGAPIAGRVGFWGKHDAVSAFADLRVVPVRNARQP